MATSAAIDSPEDVTTLLLDLAETMHQVQLPTDLVEAHLDAVATRFGVTVDPLLFQGFLAIETRTESSATVALRRIDFDAHWRLERVRRLIELARELADGRVGVSEARGRVQAIRSLRGMYPHPLVIAAYGAYSVAVAARVGGRWIELVVAGLMGVVAGMIHYGTIRYRQVDLQKSFVAGAVGTAMALLLAEVLPPFDYARALFGGMTLLVPAMMIAIGTHELAAGALESGVSRLAYGAMRFVMLAAGIVAVVKLWKLFLPIPAAATAVALPQPTVLAILVVGGAALTFCLQARMRDMPLLVVAALVAYAAQAVAKYILGSDVGAPALAAFILGAVAYLHARISGHVAATMIVAGLLQIAPGFMGTHAVINSLSGKPSEGAFSVALVAIQLVVGLLAATVLFGQTLKPKVGEEKKPRAQRIEMTSPIPS